MRKSQQKNRHIIALYTYVKIVYDTNFLNLRNSRMRGTDAEQAFQGHG